MRQAFLSVWQNLTPGRKRLLFIGLLTVGLFGSIWLLLPQDETGRQSARRRQAVTSIMVDDNTREVTVEGLSAQVRELNDNVLRLQRERDADRRAHLAALEAQASALRREILGARGQAASDQRAALREIERRIAELGGNPAAPPPEPDPPAVARRGAAPVDPPAQPDPPGRVAEPVARQPNPIAADPVTFGALPPQVELGTAATVEAPRSPLGDLSPTAVFGAPRARPEPVLPATGRPGAGAAPGRPPAAETIRYVAPPAPVEQANRPIPRTRPGNDAFLPAGAILSGIVLAGFDAPTGRNARRDPLPALVRLSDLAILPNRFKADVRECFLLVSGFGDLSSERAYMRGETFSCVLTDGTVVQERVEGYAAGEDGKAGVRGRLVSKQGEFVGRAILIGLIQGVAEAFRSTRGVTIGVQGGGGFSLDSAESNFSNGLVTGGGRALDRIARFYLDQAGDLFPVIEIAAGRKIDVILTGGATLRLPG